MRDLTENEREKQEKRYVDTANMIRDNPDAVRYFQTYMEIREFMTRMEYGSDTTDRLRRDALISAASIIHDEVLRLEFGEEDDE